MKYYAVKNGRNPGVYEQWEECKAQVDGFSGAIYKSFSSLQEARLFLDEAKSISQSSEADCVAYVDGSYDHSILAYGSGAVIFYQGEKFTFSEMGNDAALVGMRNVAGEIIASMYAMSFAAEHQCKHLEICYDYAGIENWCSGTWKANKEGTKAYRNFYKEKCSQMKITFRKIKSHSHHALNDEADLLAKKALGIA